MTPAATIDHVSADGVDDTASALLIDERGIIHLATVNVSYGEGVRHGTNYTVVRAGTKSPDPPAWLANVLPSAVLDGGLDVFNFDRTSVEHVHTLGDAVPAGSIVTVVSNRTLHETALEKPFAESECYLWLLADGTLRATADRPDPGGTRTLNTEVTVTVHAPDGGELFSSSVGPRDQNRQAYRGAARGSRCG